MKLLAIAVFTSGAALGIATMLLVDRFPVLTPCTSVLTSCGDRTICYDRCAERVIWCAPDV